MCATKPIVTNEGMLGVCVLLCIHKTVCGGRGRVCVLQQGTAWPYSVNGSDCYCGSRQQNAKITRAVEGATGAEPTGFIVFSRDTKVFIPRDHKVGSQSCGSQNKYCGVPSPHIKQTALFHTEGVDSSPCQRLERLSCRDTPVHIFLIFSEEFIKLRAAFQSV